jgi:hypothetical protein
MARTEDLAPETPSGTTRRTVLKAAGHAAWMIPAVQIASQVPAMAAASDILAISAQGTKSTGSTLTIAGVTVKNNSPSHTTAALTAHLNFTVSTGAATQATVSNVTGNWSADATSVTVGNNKTFSVPFTATSQVANGATGSPLGATISFNKGAGTISAVSVVFGASGFTGATATPV